MTKFIFFNIHLHICQFRKRINNDFYFRCFPNPWNSDLTFNFDFSLLNFDFCFWLLSLPHPSKFPNFSDPHESCLVIVLILFFCNISKAFGPEFRFIGRFPSPISWSRIRSCDKLFLGCVSSQNDCSKRLSNCSKAFGFLIIQLKQNTLLRESSPRIRWISFLLASHDKKIIKILHTLHTVESERERWVHRIMSVYIPN